MRTKTTVMMLALGAAPLTAIAVAKVSGFRIAPGMALIMSVDVDAAKSTLVTGVSTASLTDADRAIAAKFTGGSYRWAMGPKSVPIESGTDGIPPLADVRRDRVKFSFVPLQPPGHTLLIVENGYAEAITYQARITVKGKQAPTDVCLVMPGKRGYEHWPYAIDQIEIGTVTRRKWTERDGVTCQ